MSKAIITPEKSEKKAGLSEKSVGGGGGMSVGGLDQLSAIADASPMVSGLGSMASLAGRSGAAQKLDEMSAMMQPKPKGDAGSSGPPSEASGGGDGGADEQPPEPEAGMKLSFEQDLLLLQGKVSVGAKIGNFFKKESSTFTQLQAAVNRYSKAASPADKDAIRPEIVTLGKQWLTKHPNPADANDMTKKQSIERIVRRLEAQDTAPVELASMDDKVTAGARIKEMVTGDASTFQKIQPVYDEYMRITGGEIASFADLTSIFRQASVVKAAVTAWKDKHGASQDAGDIEKLRLLTIMENNLGKLNIGFNIPPYFSGTAERINMAALEAGRFQVEVVTLNIQLPSGTATGSITNASVTEQGFDFESITLGYEGDIQVLDGVTVSSPKLTLLKEADAYSVTGSGGLEVALMPKYGIDSLEAGGTFEVTYNLSEKKFTAATLADGSLNVTLFKTLTLTAEGVNYADGVMTAAKGSISTDMMDNTITASLHEFSYSKASGVGFSKATIETGAEGGFEPIEGFSVKEPSLELAKTGEDWSLTGAGTLDINIDGSLATLTTTGVKTSITYGVGEKKITAFSIEGGPVGLSIMDTIDVTASDVSFVDNVLTMGSVNVSFDSGTMLPGGPQLEGKATGVKVTKHTVDWEEIRVNVNKVISFGGFTFTPPEAIIKKEGDGYLVALENAQGDLKVGGWFNASGKGSMEWRPGADKPSVTSADLSISAKTNKQFPGEFLPFGWPFEVGFTVPIPAGPVPLEGGASLIIDGGTAIGADASISYDGDRFVVDGNIKINPTLTASIKIFAGAGSSLLVYIGAFFKGTVGAEANASLGIHGEASASNGYNFESLLGTYHLDANLIAELSAGMEVKAFYFFSKQLFEITLGKQWDLGTSAFDGSINLLRDGDKTKIGGSKLFKEGGVDGIPEMDVHMQTKSFTTAVDLLYAAILEVNPAAGKPSIMSEIQKDSHPEPSQFAAAKANIIQLANEAVSKSFSETDLVNLNREMKKYTEALDKMNAHYEAWKTTEQAKLDEAPETGGTRSHVIFGHLQNKPYYRDKMLKGEEKHKVKIKPKADKLRELQNKKMLYQRQTAIATAIFAEIDKLLDPTSAFTSAEISAMIEKYMVHVNTLSTLVAGQSPDIASEPPVDYDAEGD